MIKHDGTQVPDAQEHMSALVDLAVEAAMTPEFHIQQAAFQAVCDQISEACGEVYRQ